MKTIRARFIGLQEMHDGTFVCLYNILEPIGEAHPTYSTVTSRTLERHGLTPVEAEKNLSQ